MSLHKKIASLLGYQLVRRYKADMSTSALTLANVLEHCRVDTVLDVGANYGQFAQETRQHGFTGDIHSFEPIAAAYDKLRQSSAQDAKWHAHQLALGTARGEHDINVAEVDNLSSFHRASEYGKNRYKKIAACRTEKVRVDTVDEWRQTWRMAEFS